jgi:hypothetical protein
MQRLIRYGSSAHPNPGCKLFDELDIDEDLARLEAWLSTAFTEEPPRDHVPGLWFGLIDVDRGGQPTLDMHVSGGYPDDEGPLDRVIGGSWEPRDGLRTLGYSTSFTGSLTPEKPRDRISPAGTVPSSCAGWR